MYLLYSFSLIKVLKGKVMAIRPTMDKQNQTKWWGSVAY